MVPASLHIVSLAGGGGTGSQPVLIAFVQLQPHEAGALLVGVLLSMAFGVQVFNWWLKWRKRKQQ